MKPWEAVEQKLESATGVTNIVGTRILHGTQPQRQRIPCINYFMIAYSQGTRGITESPVYQISCWAGEADEAMELAREVMITFQNAQCAIGVFDLQGAWVEDLRLIPEPETGTYHVPVTVRLVYESADNV